MLCTITNNNAAKWLMMHECTYFVAVTMTVFVQLILIHTIFFTNHCYNFWCAQWLFHCISDSHDKNPALLLLSYPGLVINLMIWLKYCRPKVISDFTLARPSHTGILPGKISAIISQSIFKPHAPHT